MIFGVLWWVYVLAVVAGTILGSLAAVVLAAAAGLLWGLWGLWGPRGEYRRSRVS